MYVYWDGLENICFMFAPARHGTWRYYEEWLLVLGERLYGRDWSKITELIPSRTPMQVNPVQ